MVGGLASAGPGPQPRPQLGPRDPPRVGHRPGPGHRSQAGVAPEVVGRPVGDFLEQVELGPAVEGRPRQDGVVLGMKQTDGVEGVEDVASRLDCSYESCDSLTGLFVSRDVPRAHAHNLRLSSPQRLAGAPGARCCCQLFYVGLGSAFHRTWGRELMS